MAACSLYLHLGSSKHLKTPEQKFIFQIGTLIIPEVLTNAFHFINLFLFSCHHIPTNNFSLPWPTYIMNSLDKNKSSHQKENTNCMKKILDKG